MTKLHAGDELAKGSQRRMKIPKLFQFFQRLIPEHVRVAVELPDPLAQDRRVFQLIGYVFRHGLLQVNIGYASDPRRSDLRRFTLHDDAELKPAQHQRWRQWLFGSVALSLGIHLLPESFPRGCQLTDKFVRF